MADLKADEISKILREQIENYRQTFSGRNEVWRDPSSWDGMRASTASKVMAAKCLPFSRTVFGLALNL